MTSKIRAFLAQVQLFLVMAKSMLGEAWALASLARARSDGTLEAILEGSKIGEERAQTNLVGLFIGIMIAAIVALQVMIPVVYDAIESSNLTGTEATIAGLIPLFAVLLLLISLAAPLMRRL